MLFSRPPGATSALPLALPYLPHKKSDARAGGVVLLVDPTPPEQLLIGGGIHRLHCLPKEDHLFVGGKRIVVRLQLGEI